MRNKEPNRNVYVGHRYVPKIMGEWDKKISYEGLSIVLNEGHSYTSKGYVPVGIDIKNEEFWALTGNYNAQVEHYRQTVVAFDDRITENHSGIESHDSRITANKNSNTQTQNELNTFKTDTNNSIAQRVKKDELIINVMDYGAKGDGVTNDRDSIEQAGTVARETGGTLLIPSGHTFSISGDLDLHGVMFINSPGVIQFTSEHNKLLLENDSARADFKSFVFGDVFRGTIEIKGMKNGHFTFGFAPKLLLYADGDKRNINAVAYNYFHLGRIDYLEINSDNTGGWINENKFFGGRINVLTIDGDYHHNHNIFYAPTIENTITTQRLEILKGGSNHIYNARWEGSGGIVTFGEGTFDNVLERSWSGASGGYSLKSYRIYNVDDKGVNNKTVHALDKYTNQNDLFSLTTNSENYNTDYFIKEGNLLRKTFGSIYESIFETGIFKVSEPFSIGFNSDSDSWRLTVNIYDINGEVITDDEIRSNTIQSFTMTNHYSGAISQPVNRSTGSFNFIPHPQVSYIDIRVVSYTENTFSYLNVYSLTNMFNEIFIPVKETIKVLRGSKKPTGEWKQGTYVKNINPGENKPIGWVMDSNNEWIETGFFQPLKLHKEGTYIATGDGSQHFFTIPHGLGKRPEKFNVMPGNINTGMVGIRYINITGANLIVFLNAPIELDDEVNLMWWVEG